MDSKFKLTKLERNWIFYDVANSAFTLMVSTLIPIFFNSLAESEGVSSVDYLAYWGYSISLSTLAVAIMGPILGGICDRRGRKKPVFMGVIALGADHCNFHNVVACTQCLDALQGDERPRSTILALHYYHRELNDASILLYGYVAGLVLDT